MLDTYQLPFCKLFLVNLIELTTDSVIDTTIFIPNLAPSNLSYKNVENEKPHPLR